MPVAESMLKRCIKCDIEQPVSEFYKHRNACKKCECQRAREYAAAHPEATKARAHQRYWSNPEAGRQAARDWQIANKERKDEAKRQWAASNPDKVRAMKAREYVKHRDAYIKRERLKRLALTPEQRAAGNANHRDWCARNREHTRFYHRNRIAQKRATDDGTVTKEAWDALVEHYDHRCAYCFSESSALEMDHVVPVSKGGAHSIENIVPACRSCNAGKGPKLLTEWLGLNRAA